MRSIAAPFALQCKRCGYTLFREDADGNLPDGLVEYFEYMEQWQQKPHERVPSRLDLCHCGATMVLNTECDDCGSTMVKSSNGQWYCGTCLKFDPPGGLGPVWFCEVCQSWRKADV